MKGAVPKSPQKSAAAPALKVRSLAELQAVKKQLAKEKALRIAQEAARLAAERQALASRNLFALAVGAVQPLAAVPRKVSLQPEPPAPIALQQQRDEEAVLREAWSDGFDASTLLDTDADLSFRRSGIGPDVVRRLRRGEWSIQREIDLHGLRSDEAREALALFLREARKQGVRCVRVVHGKGLGSPGKIPVLKNKVHSWLVQKNTVLAFVQATPAQGGAGALLVLLAPAGSA